MDVITVPPKGDSEKRVNAYFTPLKVEAQASPDMTVKIQPGSFWSAQGTHVEYIGGNSPVLTAPASNAKWVVVALNENGLIDVLNGVSGTNPDLPVIPDTSIPLAGVFIGDTTLTITIDMVFDIRPLWSVRPENIPNLAGELAMRPTATDMNAALANKADTDGTTSPTFILNKNHVGVSSTDVELIVNRGSEPDVSIRWNETAEQWEFSNDGSVWGPIGMSAGVFYTKVELDTGSLDTRYYQNTLLDGGVLDSRYYTEIESDALFAPIAHTHVAADITDLVSVISTSSPVLSVAGKIGTVTLNEADITDLDKYATVAGAVTGNIVEFGPTGLVDSGAAVADFASAIHTHVSSDITDFSVATDLLIGASSIGDLLDVVTAGPGDGHVLAYNTTSGWYVNRFLNTADLGDVDNTGAINGEILIHNGVKFINRLPLKADVSDFTDSDYVLTLGTVAQNISGIKTFADATNFGNGITVNGLTTNITTPTVTFSANTLLLNNGQASTDGGITIDRGIDPAAKIFWDETGSQWTAGPNFSGQYQPIVLGAHTHVAAEIIDFVAATTVQLGLNDLDTIQDVTYPTGPVNNEFLKYVGGQWNNVVPIASDISDFATAVTSELNTNNLDTIQDVTYITALVDRHALMWDGAVDNRWENRLLVKADVSDFNELDYVHVTGNETVAGDKTFSNNMVVNGNLTVNGTTTTIDSTTVAIADNVFTLNKDEAGAGVTFGTAGLEVERGTEPNVMFYWDEATDTWRAHHNPGSGLVVDTLSFVGHQHILADITDITVNALSVNQLAGISTVVTIQDQLNDKISRTGDTMNASANIAFSTGGEVTGLPAVPSGVTAATSKQYVDDQVTAIGTTLTTHMNDDARHLSVDQNVFLDALTLPTLTGAEVNFMVGVTSAVQTQIDSKISRTGDTMDVNADLAFNGGEVTGLPASPAATAATSKEYVDAQLLLHSADDTRHLTPNQNTFLDGLNLPTLTFGEVNFMAGVTSAVQTQIDGKANLAIPVATGNIASLTLVGDLADSGIALNDIGTGLFDIWSASKLTTDFASKTDKIIPAVIGNFAGLDATGNLVDSGSIVTDFATAIHTHVSSDITDFDTAVGTYVSGTAVLGDLSNVTDASSTGDLLQKTVTGWQNVAPASVPELVNVSSNQLIGGDKTFSGANIVIQNDLTVNGTVSTINAVDLNVTDVNITLNTGYTGTPAGSSGAGLRVVRGEVATVPQAEAVLVWDEGLSQWKGGVDGAEVFFAQVGVTVAQPDYELLVGTGAGTPQYITGISVPAPIGSKRALQVFVNGIKYIEGIGKGYTVDSYGPITITFTAGNEPLVGDDVEVYGFGYIS